MSNDHDQDHSGEHPSARSPAQSVAALAERFESIDRVVESDAWATAAYRLGMATAEQPTAHPEEALRRALELYQQAAEVFTAERAPVEHARVLNAAGSAHRMLGDISTAARRFRESLSLMAGRGVESEEASVWNNLGLVLSESGRFDDSIAAFSRSLGLVDDGTDEDIRTQLATQHNLGQAHMASGGLDGSTAAVEVLREASATARGTESTMHTGLIDHSLGVALKALAALDGAAAETHIDDAVQAFERSLTIFTSVGFPMHHAIAKHNLGHALAVRSDVESKQRALAYYEDALNLFDPRIHQAHWSEAFQNAEKVEAQLSALVPGSTRADHIASLAGGMGDDERLMFLRQRFVQLERVPDEHRRERMTAFAYAVINQPATSFVATLQTMIAVLMELPDALLESALHAQLRAHGMLDPHDQRAADFILDEAINAKLFGPQRIRVRDILEEIGWDRP